MLWATGLANEILNSDEDITIIVPLSIKNIPSSIRSKINNSCSLIQMLKYHIIKGKNSLSGLTNNNVLKSTYDTEPIYFNKFGQVFRNLMNFVIITLRKILLQMSTKLLGYIFIIYLFIIPFLLIVRYFICS